MEQHISEAQTRPVTLSGIQSLLQNKCAQRLATGSIMLPLEAPQRKLEPDLSFPRRGGCLKPRDENPGLREQTFLARNSSEREARVTHNAVIGPTIPATTHTL